VGLRRGTAEIAVAHETSFPEEAAPGKGHSPRCEMFVFVEAVDTAVAALRAQGTPVLREPTDMPWGERVAHIADPDGNSVAITSSITPG
jgi:lactoylglutathione lyase